MAGYRVRVLLEEYWEYAQDKAVEKYAKEVSKHLQKRYPNAKVITYVEANPPEDEVEEYK